ncbi:MAG: hypothetical protein CYPHOPRED_000240, partial [Cyphobasidiales sp. Tagirdzhanova-0007]
MPRGSTYISTTRPGKTPSTVPAGPALRGYDVPPPPSVSQFRETESVPPSRVKAEKRRLLQGKLREAIRVYNGDISDHDRDGLRSQAVDCLKELVQRLEDRHHRWQGDLQPVA